MHIFEQEKLDGLEHQLTSSASISYASFVEPYSINEVKIPKFKSIASYDDSDLYYVQSILVSSSWNKNDDIFDKKEVWLAKNTPEHKPTNLEHNEDIIIGHIISNWPINDDGELIPDDTDVNSLPDKYHILTGSVIYKGFSNPELKERSDKLIAEIESGTKYVSMECFFKGFDYGVLNTKNNDYKILARNEETSYLTKFLRAYGGAGQHQDYKIGRVLRNITFTGKGFVDRPANIDSIILSKNIFAEVKSKEINNLNIEKIEKIEQSGVSISQSNINSEKTIMTSDKLETETENTVATETTTVTETPVVEVVDNSFANEIAELKLAKEKLEADLSELAKTTESEVLAIKEEAAKKLKDMEEEKTKMKAELDSALEAIAAYKSKEEEMMKKEKKMKRQASLVESGLDSETAANIVEKFDSMEDDAFSAMTSLFAGKMPPWLDKSKKDDSNKTEDKEDMKAKKKASENTVDSTVLENVTVSEDVILGVGGEIGSQTESTRAALVDFVRSKIGKKVK